MFACKRPDDPVFDLAHGWKTVAVRDQMVRALMLADRLPGWIAERSDPDLPVLVAGAGAAGLTAAVALAERGIHTVVSDPNPEPFSVQLGCRRYLCPTQYDWPMPHWQGGRFGLPASRSGVPFSWSADRVPKIRTRWLAQLRSHRRRLGSRLKIHLGTAIHDIGSFGDGSAAAEFRSGPILPFSAIVLAFGPGIERDALQPGDAFRSFRFWDDDPFEAHHCGLPSAADEGTVLICGSGDGAVQDLLRILTRRPSAHDLWTEFDLDRTSIDPYRLLAAEMSYERSLNWTSTPADPRLRDPGTELRRAYENEVRDALDADSDLHRRVIAACTDGPTHLVLASDRDYLTCGYGLNRILGMILLEVMENEGRVTRHVGSRIIQLDPLAGQTGGSARDCLGKPWRAFDDAGHQVCDTNVVLLRIGLDGQDNAAMAPAEAWCPPRPGPPFASM